jgi:hypothetical protein
LGKPLKSWLTRQVYDSRIQSIWNGSSKFPPWLALQQQVCCYEWIWPIGWCSWYFSAAEVKVACSGILLTHNMSHISVVYCSCSHRCHYESIHHMQPQMSLWVFFWPQCQLSVQVGLSWNMERETSLRLSFQWGKVTVCRSKINIIAHILKTNDNEARIIWTILRLFYHSSLSNSKTSFGSGLFQFLIFWFIIFADTALVTSKTKDIAMKPSTNSLKT